MARKKAAKKEYTLSEFRAWLEGVEELQPASWTPDAAQWKVIRERIRDMVEEVVEVPIEVPAPAPVNPYEQQRPMMPSQMAPPQLPMGTASPNEPSAFVAPPEQDMTPAARAALSGKLPSEMVPDASGKIKTPNIDTKDGKYGSSFE